MLVSVTYKVVLALAAARAFRSACFPLASIIHAPHRTRPSAGGDLPHLGHIPAATRLATLLR